MHVYVYICILVCINSCTNMFAQLAGVVEYTDCTSAKG